MVATGGGRGAAGGRRLCLRTSDRAALSRRQPALHTRSLVGAVEESAAAAVGCRERRAGEPAGRGRLVDAAAAPDGRRHLEAAALHDGRDRRRHGGHRYRGVHTRRLQRPPHRRGGGGCRGRHVHAVSQRAVVISVRAGTYSGQMSMIMGMETASTTRLSGSPIGQ